MKYDMIVIGGGPGGKACSMEAAGRGLKVALVEKGGSGGAPISKGYIPMKIMLDEIIKNKAGNNPVNPAESLKTLGIRMQKAKEGWESSLERAGVKIYYGEAEIISEQEVRVVADGETTALTGENLVVATGSEPSSPMALQLDESRGIISYKDVLSGKWLNVKDVVILGGNIEGCEFATLFKKMGAAVRILEQGDGIMPMCDPDQAQFLKEEFEKQGIEVKTNSTLTQCQYNEEGKLEVICKNTADETSQKLLTDALLVTGASNPVLPRGIEKLELVWGENNRIKVNEYMETSQKGVYAIGDVIGGITSANAAILEGKTAAGSIAGEKVPVSYKGMSYVCFTDPQLSGVGLRESDARERQLNYRVKKGYFSENMRALSLGYEKGFVKILVDADKQTILGMHFAGDNIAELIPIGVLACHQDIPVKVIKDLPLAHPTMTEIIKEAL
ncbi:dihydrolipoyl dehydrogenase family protein [Isachenkonia alkalipeptolytica]|uniref:NAD(P)/FAD-dependent oxidoreductase n=1 Tax=Isachenkonia alkalipeptolytica TaxID=2565777 RepID=A0AA44BDA7_9CLOT|nr:NAD(P)/FAD-dependent oxidoreductase [Isachenkonia alkalipeptolytica]NBG87732.1 NAD(P)/FAD-dependent oxidoreductase [Isachenkonia alkalipeptolytica]